ncbi:MAG: S8 family serine peptidase [Candidatus Marinimicrobia bacterium]|nr:S8 family serine peptidase [Candidatus Neomarinimicrobiota bacterium]MCF7829390.1 S8 family serine peptidase [Candidatus Neomarinimicrobiota bacterium]MCF7880876.1 S8 family serine peptidase [Candidatus Neomarinimicrobiota bacterium]
MSQMIKRLLNKIFSQRRLSLLFGIMAGSIFIAGFYPAEVWSQDYSYPNKLTGEQFEFRPVDGQVMVKFRPGSADKSEKSRQDVDSGLNLEAVHAERLSKLQFGVYRTPAGRSAEEFARELTTRADIKKAAPAVMDRDGQIRYYMPDEVTVQFKTDLSEDQMQQVISDMGCAVIIDHWTRGFYTLTIQDESSAFQKVRAFNSKPGVKFSELSFVSYNDALFDPNDTEYSQQWSLNNDGTSGGTADADVDMQEAWDIQRGNANVLVAILDTGVDWAHPDLRQNILQNLSEDTDGDGQTIEWNGSQWVLDPGDLNGVDDDGNDQVDDLVGWDFANDDNDPTPGTNAHGTACAGIAAAVGDNNTGVTGAAHQSRILPLRIDLIAGRNQNRADAINYAVDFSGDYDGMVLSCSWRASGDLMAIENAVANAWNADVLPVFAAGNANTSPISFPARYAQTLAVAATSPCDTRKRSSSNSSEVNPGVSTDPDGTSCDGEDWWGSNFGDDLNLAAPGVIMPSTDISGTGGYSSDNYVDDFNGTSSATPLVAGAAALVLSHNLEINPANPLSVEDLVEILESTADTVGGYDYNYDPSRPGFSEDLGAGRLNIYRALQEVIARRVEAIQPSQVDLALSIDRSGSMLGDKLDAVKNAASQVVRLLGAGDKIAVTSYSSGTPPARTDFPLKSINSVQVKDSAIAAIEAITASGRTSIGGGLLEAQSQLNTASEPSYPQSLILLSDGLSNEPPYIQDVLPSIPTKTDAYTIGFGTSSTDVDEDSLRQIAFGTGGNYYFSGASGFSKPAQGSVGGLALIQSYQSALNKVAKRQSFDFTRIIESPTDTTFIDESVDEVRFTLLWELEESGTYYSLVTPSGEEITPKNVGEFENVELIQGKTVFSYRVRKPEFGPWLSQVQTAFQEQQVFLSVAGYSDIKTLVQIRNYGTQWPLKLELKLLQGGQPLPGANVTARIGYPFGQYAYIELYDDGDQGGDRVARDGVYSAEFQENGEPGSYSFEFNVEGESPKGIRFTRHDMTTAYLTDDPEANDVPVALPNFVAPGGASVKIPVKVSDDVSRFQLDAFSLQIAGDPEVLTPTGEVSLAQTLTAESWDVQAEVIEEGVVALEGKAIQGQFLSGSGVLAYLLYKVSEETGRDSTRISFQSANFLADTVSVRVDTANGTFTRGNTLLPTAVESEDNSGLPEQFALRQNYPNPFNPNTTIRYELPEETHVRLQVFDIRGQRVATLVDKSQSAGVYKTTLNASHLPSGVYFYRIQAGSFVESRKMVLLK